MINFMSFKVDPTVSCDNISEDLYPPQNLISFDKNKFHLGFMAYSVTKPPIELNFEFVCHVDVKSLNIWSQIGSLKSTSFDIFIQNKNKDFIKVGSGENPSNPGISFNNLDKETNTKDNLLPSQFFPKFRYLTRNCKCLKICIKKTARCAPVLKKIEVWGLPARSCSEKVIKEVWEKWMVDTVRQPSQKQVAPVQRVLRDEIEIPEEFLDSLTYEIMNLPMVLPSGKIVDQLTIEKHNTIEESWGRIPSDPYTGLHFSCSRKPILDASLKSRIDEFLLKNSNNTIFQNIPRTISSKLKSRRPCTVSSTTTSEPKCKKFKLDNEENCSIKPNLNSLDEAIQLALSTTTRFSQIGSFKKTEANECYKCQNDENIYQIIKCSHLICRKCLSFSQFIKLRCTCGVEFRKFDVQKFHNKITD